MRALDAPGFYLPPRRISPRRVTVRPRRDAASCQFYKVFNIPPAIINISVFTLFGKLSGEMPIFALRRRSVTPSPPRRISSRKKYKKKNLLLIGFRGTTAGSYPGRIEMTGTGCAVFL